MNGPQGFMHAQKYSITELLLHSENCDVLDVPSFKGYAWILGPAGTCKQC